MKNRLSSILVLLAVSAAAIFGASTMLTPARSSDAEGLFKNLTFAEASAQAKAENKLVFVDVWAAWCGPCKLLDTTTWTDAAVIELLQTRTVPIKINADNDVKFASQHQIEALPTLLVLRPDGTEVTRVVGYVSATAFREQLGPTLAAGP